MYREEGENQEEGLVEEGMKSPHPSVRSDRVEGGGGWSLAAETSLNLNRKADKALSELHEVMSSSWICHTHPHLSEQGGSAWSCSQLDAQKHWDLKPELWGENQRSWRSVPAAAPAKCCRDLLLRFLNFRAQQVWSSWEDDDEICGSPGRRAPGGSCHLSCHPIYMPVQMASHWAATVQEFISKRL